MLIGWNYLHSTEITQNFTRFYILEVHMHIVFRDLNDWYKKDPDLKDKFQETFATILAGAKEYAGRLNTATKSKANVSIDIRISEMLLKQALIDALDDLMRLKDYHVTKSPNRLKEMAYIVFWVLRRNPIILLSEDVTLNTKLNDIARARLLFINESFCVNLLISSAFPGGKQKSNCQMCFDEGNRQLEYFKKFLLYYLVYRLDSPKSLEAIMMGTTIFPVWEVDPVIWSDPKPLEDQF